MLIFLLVFLLLAALLEGVSLRGGTAHIGLDMHLRESRVEPGQSAPLVTRVENGGFLPITYLCVQISFPRNAVLPEDVQLHTQRHSLVADEVYRLWWRQRITRTIPVTIETRGVYSIHAVSLLRGDFLGLQTTTQMLTLRRSLLVYPKPLENAALAEALGSYCGELIAQRWLIRDPILTLGVREYTGNEPMHTISWSQTARRGALTVREFDYTRSLQCCLVFCVNGLQMEDGTLMDACCSAVRTACETLVAAGVEPELHTNASLSGYSEPVVRRYTAAVGRMQDVLEALARANAAPVCSAEKLAEECLYTQNGQTAFLVIAPRRDDAARTLCERLERGSGAAVTLIAVEELGVTP